MDAILHKYRCWLFSCEKREISRFPLLETQEGLCFSDLDYSVSQISLWPARQHLIRLLAMTANAGEEGLASSPSLRHELLSLLCFWLKGDFQNPNWWHNEIGTPRLLSSICLLLRDYLSKEALSAAERILLRGSMKGNDAIAHWTGANLLWGMLGTVGHALLTNDEQLLCLAAKRAWQELTVQSAPVDGIQPDGSFFQHGPLVYNFGYGRDFFNDTALLLHLLSGTRYMPDREQMRAYERFVLDGCLHLSHRGFADFMTIGREISRKDALRLRGGEKDMGLRAALLKETKEFERRDELQALIRSLDGKEAPPRGVKAFKNAYMLVSHSGKSYLSAKGIHKDYLCCEAGNCENDLAYNFFDGGSVCFMSDGDEYLNLSPVFNYSLVPGVTAVLEDDQSLRARIGDSGRWYAKKGETNACCVLEQQGVGVLAMELRHGCIRSFLTRIALPGCMLLMGSGITCGAEEKPIVTAIEQCRLKGSPLPRQKLLGRGESIENGGFQYTNLCDAPLLARSQAAGGSWRRNNDGAGDEPVTEDVFSLCFDHGARPQNASYAVLVTEKGANMPLPRLHLTAASHAAELAGNITVRTALKGDTCSVLIEFPHESRQTQTESNSNVSFFG